MPLYDFHCPSCDARFETIVPSTEETVACQGEGCTGKADRLMPAGHSFLVIQATHLKSKALKAGYVHSHADKPKTPGKISIGYGTKNHSRTE